MIKAVVIDVDDTLCLTEAACFEMENEVLARIGRPPMPREAHISTWGRPLFEAILDRSPGVDLDAFKREYEKVIPEYTAAGKLDAVPDENYAALDDLIAAGKDIMLLTSRTHGELKHLLEPDHLLATRVKAFYYRDNMQFHKPDPRAFDALLQQYGLRPEECVYVGDSPSDAAAANQAGLRFIVSLESGLRTREDFGEYKVDAFVARFPNIAAAVQGLAE
jgi:HAD superfamily hydrolase (TIGR01509 family)